ncbi:hypothetical protein [Reinekea sp. G2M2-21]|uniref:hypothetical protein n=1 Tax=Reinekea sp. G2M2-21 TaxID=2788942 RepID=UPI0018A92569|nr:hypothetical protein [Reinekea sp. G2M2-21]
MTTEETMNEKKPNKPEQYTESFAFIQAMFQQPANPVEKLKRSMIFGMKLVGAIALSLLLLFAVWLLISFDIGAISLTEQGLNIPRRP